MKRMQMSQPPPTGGFFDMTSDIMSEGGKRLRDLFTKF